MKKFRVVMSQPDLETSFTKKSHREPYPAVSPGNPAITAVGKIVVVIGGSKDIGLAIANAFGIASASHVVLVARNSTSLISAENSLSEVCIKTTFSSWSGDITNEQSMTDMLSSVRENLGEPDILVLSAAYLHSLKMALYVPEDELKRSFDVNFTANVSLVRKFFNPLKESSRPKIIINVATMAAHVRQMHMFAYGASKGAFVNWLEHIHFENQDKLRIHNLHPGIIMTDLLKDRGFRTGDWKWDTREMSLILVTNYDELTYAHSATSWIRRSLACF